MITENIFTHFAEYSREYELYTDKKIKDLLYYYKVYLNVNQPGYSINDFFFSKPPIKYESIKWMVQFINEKKVTLIPSEKFQWPFYHDIRRWRIVYMVSLQKQYNKLIGIYKEAELEIKSNLFKLTGKERAIYIEDLQSFINRETKRINNIKSGWFKNNFLKDTDSDPHPTLILLQGVLLKFNGKESKADNKKYKETEELISKIGRQSFFEVNIFPAFDQPNLQIGTREEKLLTSTFSCKQYAIFYCFLQLMATTKA